MAYANAKSFRQAYLLEVTPGTTPASAMSLIRSTGGGGKSAFGTAESQELQETEVTDLVRISSNHTHTINFHPAYGGQDWALEAVMGGTWTTNVLQMGIIDRAFTLEDRYVRAGLYRAFKGSRVDLVSMAFPQGGIPTGKITSTCMSVVTDDATIGTGADVAAPTGRVFNSTTSIQAITEGGALSLKGIGVTNFTIDIGRPGISSLGLGSLDAFDIDTDKPSIKGTVSLYFTSWALYDKYVADTATTVLFTVGGASTSQYQLFAGTTVLGDGGPEEVQRGNTVKQTFTWQAISDPDTTGLQITRVPPP